MNAPAPSADRIPLPPPNLRSSSADRPPLEPLIRRCCLWEATTRKAGNVHPGAAFVDLHYRDFIAAATVSAPWLARTPELGIGPAILEAVRATHHACGSNVNLGICLLIAPLAAVPAKRSLTYGVRRALEQTTTADAAAVYEAIRLLQPGGIGRVTQADVAAPPTITLLEAMSLSAARDAIGRQWKQRFFGLAHFIVPTLLAELRRAALHQQQGRLGHEAFADGPPLTVWEAAVLALQLILIERGEETLIRRKCGRATDYAARDQASAVGNSGGVTSAAGPIAWRQFDQWLRGDGHRRNPGTTADLIAAALFWIERERLWLGPTETELAQHAASIAAASAAT